MTRRACIATSAAIAGLAGLAFGFGSIQALAHGAAQWIADGGYKAPNGATCCGVSDCRRAEGAAAKRVADGYIVAVTIEGKSYALFTPKAAVFGSIDDAVWYCALPQDYMSGHARCLFLPRTV
jgi:hypothetical protein